MGIYTRHAAKKGIEQFRVKEELDITFNVSKLSIQTVRNINENVVCAVNNGLIVCGKG